MCLRALKGRPSAANSFICCVLYNSFCVCSFSDKVGQFFLVNALGACNIAAALYLLYFIEIQKNKLQKLEGLFSLRALTWRLFTITVAVLSRVTWFNSDFLYQNPYTPFVFLKYQLLNSSANKSFTIYSGILKAKLLKYRY